jgi:hypothetical protein
LLELVDGSFDEVAALVERGIEVPVSFEAGSLRDDRAWMASTASRMALVPYASSAMTWSGAKPSGRVSTLGVISGLSGCDDEADGSAAPIDGEVDLGRRPSERLPLYGSMPEACRFQISARRQSSSARSLARHWDVRELSCRPD